MPQLVIRKGAESDIAAIAALEQACFSSPQTLDMIKKDMLENKMAGYIVAELEGAVIGYIGFWCIIEECQINSVAVSPALRNQHIATIMLHTCIDATRAAGIKAWKLEVRAGNEAGKALYKKSGFVENGIRRDYYRDPKEDALLMILGE